MGCYDIFLHDKCTKTLQFMMLFIIVNVLNSFSSLKNVPYLMNFKVYTYSLVHNLNQRTIAQCGCISNDCVIFCVHRV